MGSLKKTCSDSLNLEIIAFFHENPSTVDSANGIAAWLNQNTKQLEKALDYLVSEEILVSHGNESTKAYSYTQDRKIVSELEKLLKDKV